VTSNLVKNYVKNNIHAGLILHVPKLQLSFHVLHRVGFLPVKHMGNCVNWRSITLRVIQLGSWNFGSLSGTF